MNNKLSLFYKKYFRSLLRTIYKKEIFLPLIFLFFISFTFPIALLTAYGGALRYFIQPICTGSTATLCILLLLLDYKKIFFIFRKTPFFLIPFFGFLLISVIHFILHSNYRVEEFFSSLSWFIIPFFVYCYSKTFINFTPYYCTLLWIFNISYSYIQYAMHDEVVGLPGNRNWNANFSIIGYIFFIFMCIQIYKKLKCGLHKQNKFGRAFRFGYYIIISSTSVLNLFVVYLCKSRGTWLSLILSLPIIGIISLGKKTQKLFIYILITLFLITTVLFYFKGTALLSNYIKQDVRIPIWEGTINLIHDYPFIGVGSASFETTYHYYRTPEYFLCPMVAIRTNHPHNHFLFIATTLGIPLCILWAFLFIYPINFLITKFYFLQNHTSTTSNSTFTESAKQQLYPILLSLIIILIHSMFDLILFQWPTNYIGLILLGILWSKTWGTNVNIIREERPSSYILNLYKLPVLKIMAFLSIILLISILSINIRKNTLNTLYLRNAIRFSEDNTKIPAAAYYFKQAIKYKNTPLTAYKGAMHAFFMLNNIEITLFYFDKLQKTVSPTFAHSNGFMGLVCFKRHLYKLALAYFIKETLAYPLNVGSWYNLYITYMKLNKKEKAKEIYERLLYVLKLKNLNEKYIPLLLKKPRYDMRPWEIPKSQRPL